MDDSITANGQGTVMYECAEFSSPEEQRPASHDRGVPDTAESATALHRQDAEARGDMYRFLPVIAIGEVKGVLPEANPHYKAPEVKDKKSKK